MKDAIYFDTREGGVGIFARPPSCGDYSAWLASRYAESNQSVPWGIAQKIHAAIFAAVKHDTDLVAIGPGAGAIAKLIETISSNAVEVTVV